MHFVEVIDDYGNVQHWTTTVHAWHSLGLYGYSAWVFLGPIAGIDFGEISRDPR